MRMRLAVSGVAVCLFVGALVPELAKASGHASYQLTKKNGECRRGYVRQVRHVKKREHGKTVRVRQVWCVFRVVTPKPPPNPPPALTPTATVVSSTTGPEAAARVISASLQYFLGSEAHELRGEPITITIGDATTGHTVGSFTATSNFYAGCTITLIVEHGRTTFYGNGVPPYAACALGRVSMSAGDLATLVASFAGNATYAASHSKEEPFG